MANKKDNKKKKSFFKMQPKSAAEDKGTIEEFLYMIPAAVTVRDLEGAVTGYPEEKKEIWTELDMMEVVLPIDSLIFENMMDTFDSAEDQAFLQEKGIQVVYAFNYNTRDKEAVKAVLAEIHRAFGGFVASDTEDLEPTFEVGAF